MPLPRRPMALPVQPNLKSHEASPDVIGRGSGMFPYDCVARRIEDALAPVVPPDAVVLLARLTEHLEHLAPAHGLPDAVNVHLDHGAWFGSELVHAAILTDARRPP